MARQNWKAVLALAVLGAGTMLAGCRSTFSADVRNMTPQPVFAQIYERHGTGQTVLASQRLGPGDRAVIGPVRGQSGRVGIAIDTSPNPQSPYRTDLRGGANHFNVRQEGERAGRLQIQEVTP